MVKIRLLALGVLCVSYCSTSVTAHAQNGNENSRKRSRSPSITVIEGPTKSQRLIDGTALYKKKEIDSATKVLSECVAMDKEEQYDPEDRTSLHFMMGNLHFHNDRWDDAQHHLGICLDSLAREKKLPALTMLAYLAERENKWSLAKSYWMQALDLTDTILDPATREKTFTGIFQACTKCESRIDTSREMGAALDEREMLLRLIGDNASVSEPTRFEALRAGSPRLFDSSCVDSPL